MEGSGEKYVYKDGVRFEVTSDGLFYAPEESPSPKKHPCPDCRFCQWCAEARCKLCRERTGSEPSEKNRVFKMI